MFDEEDKLNGFFFSEVLDFNGSRFSNVYFCNVPICYSILCDYILHPAVSEYNRHISTEKLSPRCLIHLSLFVN